MADRYWRSGSTNWSAAASWSATYGGAASSVPTVNDDVYFFDNATVSSGGGICRTLYIGGVTVTWSSTTGLIIGASTTAGTGNITIDGTLNHTGSATFVVYGDLQINSVFNQSTTGAGTITMSGSRDCNIYQGGGALNKLTISKSTNAVNVYLNSTLYVNYTKTSGNGVFTHTQGYLRQQYNEIYCTIFTSSAGRNHEMSNNIVVFCQTSGATTITYVAPTTLSNRDGAFITRGFTVATTVSMGSGTAAATAPNLRIEDNTTVTSSGNVYSLYCDGTMSGSLTVFTSFTGGRNNNMSGFTLTYGVTAAGESRDFYWTGTIGALTFTPTNGSATQTGCTYNLNYARASGTITASSNSTNYYFNDVNWTSTAAQCNGSSSYYAFGNGAETKWTTGGLTCSGGASTYDFTNLNPTGASTLNCAGSAVSGTGCTYNFGLVRGTAALAISCAGVTQNNFNVNNVVILGNFTFTIGTLNLISTYGEWLYVAGFNTNSGSTRTINFNDRRIVTSGTGAFDSTTVTGATFNRGGYDSGGIQLGGSGASVFGAANTTQSLRVWIERSGSTSITSGNIRSLKLNNGTLSGTVTINVESISTDTGTGIASSSLNLTLSTTDNAYQSWDWSYTTFASVTFAGVGTWDIANLTATNMTCNASSTRFNINGYCNITTAVILQGSNSSFYLYNINGSTLTATSGGNNYYWFQLTDGSTDRGFSTSMIVGATATGASTYEFVYVHQIGYIYLQGTFASSTYNFYDTRIAGTSGIIFINRGTMNLWGDIYTSRLYLNGNDGVTRNINFRPDGTNYHNFYLSGTSTTMFDATNSTNLVLQNASASETDGVLFISDWNGSTTRGYLIGPTTGILANGANVFSLCWASNVNCTSISNSWYHFKTYNGLEVAGVQSATGQTITVYGNLYIADRPFYGGAGGSWSFVDFTMTRSDGTAQYFHTGTDQGWGWQGYTIRTLTLNTNGTVYLTYYSQITNLTHTNGTLDLNGQNLFVNTVINVTNNANAKGLVLSNDININATSGSVFSCANTSNITCTGGGNIVVRGGTINSGGTTRKYTDQFNFYMTGEAAYTLTSPFTCRNLTTNNYTPPASWTLYVGGNLAWNWSSTWPSPNGTINFFAASGSGTISSNGGINAAYTLGPVNVQNGFILTVSGGVTFSTATVVASILVCVGANMLVQNLLSGTSGSNFNLENGTVTLAGSGGTQTTSGFYMDAGSTLTTLALTGPLYVTFTGSGEKYFTVPTTSGQFANNFISVLTNQGAFNSGTLTGYLNMYNSFTVGLIRNLVNPSGFRQQTSGSTINVGSWSVTGTSGALAYWRNPATANMVKTTSGNVTADYMSIAFSTVTGNGSGQLWYAGANSVDNGNNSGWIFAAAPTYSLAISGGATTVNEGSSFTVVLTTTGVTNGTNVPYTITGAGITTGDIGGASLTGNFTVSSGTASVTFNVTADAATEGTESFTLSLNNGLASVSISILDTSINPTYSLSTSGAVTTVNEGSSVTIILTTTNLSDGTTVAYTLGGTISSADILGGSLSGNFTVSSNSASVTIAIVADNLTEGSETLTLTLTGPGTNISVTVLDTSLTPSLSKGNFLMFFPA
jgi:hypothetical protein